MIKSPEEIRHLSRINLATAKAITVAFEIANPGDTEKEIAQNMITLALGARDVERVAGEALKPGFTVLDIHNVVKRFYTLKMDYAIIGRSLVMVLGSAVTSTHF